MDFFKSLRQSFLKFKDPEAISKKLEALIRREYLKKLKKSENDSWIFLKI